MDVDDGVVGAGLLECRARRERGAARDLEELNHCVRKHIGATADRRATAVYAAAMPDAR